MKYGFLFLLGMFAVATSSGRVANMAIIYDSSDSVYPMLDNSALPLAFSGIMRQKSAAVLTGGGLANTLVLVLAQRYFRGSEDNRLKEAFGRLLASCARVQTAAASGKQPAVDDDNVTAAFSAFRKITSVFDQAKGGLSDALPSDRLLAAKNLLESIQHLKKAVEPCSWMHLGLEIKRLAGFGLDSLISLADEIDLAEWNVYTVMTPRRANSGGEVVYGESAQRMVLFVPKTMDWMMPGLNVGLNAGDPRYGKYASLRRLPTDTPEQVQTTLNELLTVTAEAKRASESVAATIGAIFDPHAVDISWNFYLLGHGMPGEGRASSDKNRAVYAVHTLICPKPNEDIAGMPAAQFLRLMSMLVGLNTNIIVYETCYGGGFHAQAVGDTIAISDIMHRAAAGGEKRRRPTIVSLSAEDRSLEIYDEKNFKPFFKGLLELFEKKSIDSKIITEKLRELIPFIQNAPALILTPDAKIFDLLDPEHPRLSEILVRAATCSDAALNILLSSKAAFSADALGQALASAASFGSEENLRQLLEYTADIGPEAAQKALLNTISYRRPGIFKILWSELQKRGLLSPVIITEVLVAAASADSGAVLPEVLKQAGDITPDQIREVLFTVGQRASFNVIRILCEELQKRRALTRSTINDVQAVVAQRGGYDRSLIEGYLVRLLKTSVTD